MMYPPPQIPPCVHGDSCWRKDCIFAHPDTRTIDKPQQSRGGSAGGGVVCLAFITNTCKFGEKCRHRHDPSPDEIERLRAQFADTPCKHGLECANESCLFKHNQTTSHNPYGA
jgi:ribosomal protein S27E